MESSSKSSSGVNEPGAMKVRMKLSEYLFRRMYEAGCRQAFGVPGDFNLGLLNRLLESSLGYVGCCNELNAAYAADGCARVSGLAACVTTYAVGELSAMNGIAGAYAETVPVIKLTGAPARKFYKGKTLLHHTLGDYLIPQRAFASITTDHCLLDNPATAAQEINRCLRNCVRHKLPVYIAVPSDMVDEELVFECSEAMDGSGPDDNLLIWTDIESPHSDKKALEEAVAEIAGLIKVATRPLLIPGVQLIRRNFHSRFAALVEHTNIPYTTMLLAKGILDESHPNFVGLYQGIRSRPDVRKIVEASDCVIVLGEKLTDLNTGGFSQAFNDKNAIMVNYDNIKIKNHSYNEVYLPDVLKRLMEVIPERTLPYYNYVRANSSCVNRPGKSGACGEGDRYLTMKTAFSQIANYLTEDMVLIAETGSSMFATAETLLPRGTIYIGQTFYGSIGYSVGACLGACMAVKKQQDIEREETGAVKTDRKVMLIVGDGSFQLTCQEVSTIGRYGCTPTIIIINNDGYLIERVITDNTYNDIQRWNYAMLPAVFGFPEGTKCHTMQEFEDALKQAAKEKEKMSFIEGVFEKWDCNKLLKSAGRMMALNNHLEPSITDDMLADTPTEKF